MKTLITLTLIFVQSTLLAQHFNSIQVVPANPTTNDTILVIADMWFSSGTCDQAMQSVNVNGNSIYCSTIHCTGMLTVICYDVDTFKINPLPVGNYTTYLQVDAGGLPAPCTPGIVPGDSDSISFIVTPLTGVAEMEDAQFFTSQLNGNTLTLNFTDASKIATISLSDVSGRIIEERETAATVMKFLLPQSSGIYIIKAEDKKGKSQVLKIVK